MCCAEACDSGKNGLRVVVRSKMEAAQNELERGVQQ